MVWGIKMENLIPFFTSVLNFQGDPEVPLTPPNSCAQLFFVSLTCWLVGDTEGKEFADTGQLCFE